MKGADPPPPPPRSRYSQPAVGTHPTGMHSCCSNCSLEGLTTQPPPVLTSSGGHRNTYGWQAGGKHPTGMRSHLNFLGRGNKINIFTECQNQVKIQMLTR